MALPSSPNFTRKKKVKHLDTKSLIEKPDKTGSLELRYGLILWCHRAPVQGINLSVDTKRDALISVKWKRGFSG